MSGEMSLWTPVRFKVTICREEAISDEADMEAMQKVNTDTVFEKNAKTTDWTTHRYQSQSNGFAEKWDFKTLQSKKMIDGRQKHRVHRLDDLILGDIWRHLIPLTLRNDGKHFDNLKI